MLVIHFKIYIELYTLSNYYQILNLSSIFVQRLDMVRLKGIFILIHVHIHSFTYIYVCVYGIIYTYIRMYEYVCIYVCIWYIYIIHIIYE